MKNKLILALLTLALVLSALVSCQTNTGTPSFTIDSNGYLIAEYPNGDSQIVGSVKPSDGKDGADGKSVNSAIINSDGELILTFSDGAQSNLGKIIGTDGKDGTNGKDGKDGKDGTNGKDGIDGSNGQDGIGIKSINIQNGQLYVQYTNGESFNLGKVVGENGRGIQSIQLINNVWHIQYTDDTTETVVPKTVQGDLEVDSNTDTGYGELHPVH